MKLKSCFPIIEKLKGEMIIMIFFLCLAVFAAIYFFLKRVFQKIFVDAVLICSIEELERYYRRICFFMGKKVRISFRNPKGTVFYFASFSDQECSSRENIKYIFVRKSDGSSWTVYHNNWVRYYDAKKDTKLMRDEIANTGRFPLTRMIFTI